MSLWNIARKIATEAQYLLFVYGTLMQGGEAHDKLSGATFLGPVKTEARYSLFDLGDEYFTIIEGNEQICGELYELDDALLTSIDVWEHDVYRRRQIRLEDGKTVFAYVV